MGQSMSTSDGSFNSNDFGSGPSFSGPEFSWSFGSGSGSGSGYGFKFGSDSGFKPDSPFESSSGSGWDFASGSGSRFGSGPDSGFGFGSGYGFKFGSDSGFDEGFGSKPPFLWNFTSGFGSGFGSGPGPEFDSSTGSASGFELVSDTGSEARFEFGSDSDDGAGSDDDDGSDDQHRSAEPTSSWSFPIFSFNWGRSGGKRSDSPDFSSSPPANSPVTSPAASPDTVAATASVSVPPAPGVASATYAGASGCGLEGPSLIDTNKRSYLMRLDSIYGPTDISTLQDGKPQSPVTTGRDQQGIADQPAEKAKPQDKGGLGWSLTSADLKGSTAELSNYEGGLQASGSVFWTMPRFKLGVKGDPKIGHSKIGDNINITCLGIDNLETFVTSGDEKTRLEMNGLNLETYCREIAVVDSHGLSLLDSKFKHRGDETFDKKTDTDVGEITGRASVNRKAEACPTDVTSLLKDCKYTLGLCWDKKWGDSDKKSTHFQGNVHLPEVTLDGKCTWKQPGFEASLMGRYNPSGDLIVGGLLLEKKMRGLDFGLEGSAKRANRENSLEHLGLSLKHTTKLQHGLKVESKAELKQAWKKEQKLQGGLSFKLCQDDSKMNTLVSCKEHSQDGGRDKKVGGCVQKVV